MKIKKLIQLYFLYSLSINAFINAEGFCKNTLIQTPQGRTAIQDLKINDLVTLQNNTTNHNYHIVDQHNYKADNYIKIKILDTTIYTALDQKFYSLTRNKWVTAENLTSSESILCANSSKIMINAIECIHKPIILYSLTVHTSHLYCVSPYNIIVHNFEPASAGTAALISLACPPAAPFVITAEAIIGTIITGIGLFSAYKKHKHKKTFAQISEELKNNTSYTPNPKKTNDDDDHPHGIYENASYHHQNSSGRKSPPPKDGQHCLDHSLPYINNQRIAIEGDNFIVLKQTSPGKFHGHTISWREIPRNIQKILEHKGYTKESGKIINQITEKSPI